MCVFAVLTLAGSELYFPLGSPVSGNTVVVLLHCVALQIKAPAECQVVFQGRWGCVHLAGGDLRLFLFLSKSLRASLCLAK